MEDRQFYVELWEALQILKNGLKTRDTIDAHNFLIDGSYEYDYDNEEESEKMEDLMEQELEQYLEKLYDLIDKVREKALPL